VSASYAAQLFVRTETFCIFTMTAVLHAIVTKIAVHQVEEGAWGGAAARVSKAGARGDEERKESAAKEAAARMSHRSFRDSPPLVIRRRGWSRLLLFFFALLSGESQRHS
jgi:hypothetical protein